MHSVGDTIVENIRDDSVSKVLVMESFSSSSVKWCFIWLPNLMILVMFVLKLIISVMARV